MGNDLAAQYRAVVAEARAARKAREQLGRLRNDLFGDHPHAAERLAVILARWDQTPRAVLDHDPDRPDPTARRP